MLCNLTGELLETLTITLAMTLGCLGGATVRALAFRPSGRGFDSRSGRHQGT